MIMLPRSQKCLKKWNYFKKEAINSGLVTEKEFNKIVDPAKMVKPGK
jgi:fumarate hydratase class II